MSSIAEGSPVELPINVSARILRHLSRGIYRTPAGALKELVSNAYDARARTVTISTGFPAFDKIIVSDDGDGIAFEKFAGIIQSIGLSDKIAGEPLNFTPGTAQRRVIGHYGVGLLAVGQLAANLILFSKQRGTRHGLKAEIDFNQFEVTADQKIAHPAVKDERSLEEQDLSSHADRFPIGSCVITPLTFPPEDEDPHFTRLELQNIRAEVHRKLSGRYRDLNPSAAAKQRYSSTFEDLLALFREREGEVRQGQYPYEQLCWELALYSPLPYPAILPFKPGGPLADIALTANASDFTVRMDGFSLYKPFDAGFFEERPEKIFSWLSEPYTSDPNGPRVTGYLIYKRRIRPKAMQGILIRESGVAIGSHDPTYLEYPYNEGQKFNQLTGELFAEGLSGALNIDRNSFNETDDRYLALSSWLHGKLQKQVFPDIKKLQKSPGSSTRERNLRLTAAALSRYATSVGRRTLKITFESKGPRSGLFTASSRTLTINQDHRVAKGSSAQVDTLLLGGFLLIAGAVDATTLNDLIDTLPKAKRDQDSR